MTDPGLSIIGSIAPGFPARLGQQVGPDSKLPRARWLQIRPDGRVMAFTGKVEYGQSIRTGFVMEVADELRVPISHVDIVLGDTDLTPWDMGTFGSQSTARAGLQLRRAAATAREALLDLASSQLDLPPQDLTASDGAVFSKADPGRRVTYGQLVAGQAIEREVDFEARLTEAGSFRVMGTDAQRIDAEARVTGRSIYSQDVSLPGMLFGRVLSAPWLGARIVSADASQTERMPGVTAVVKEQNWLAVLAADDDVAEQALAAIEVVWDEQPEGTHLDIPLMLEETKRDANVVQERGDTEDALRRSEHVLEATYYVPHICNLPMEPRAAVADWQGDSLTVWAGTQRPFGLRGELATEFGIAESNVHVIVPEIGGAFGAKSWYPAAAEAARLSRTAGRPVRVAYSRQQDTISGTFRPAALLHVKSGFRSDGTITAWEFNAVHSGPHAFVAQRGSETPYEIENVKVTIYCGKALIRVGSYRSLGGAVNHFATESHVDEIAAAIGMDAVEFRLRNLSHPRFRRVLESAADRFGWSTSSSTSSHSGLGVAVGTDVGSFVGTCAEVMVEGRSVKVRRVTTAFDCGLTVNPEGARSQVEGTVIMGLGAALYEAIDVGNGVVLNSTLTRYQVPRINDTPDIEVVLVGDPETPSTGAGEPGIVTVAPAIANAIFDGTRQRLRELPLQRQLR